jgi:O-antigen ligase
MMQLPRGRVPSVKAVGRGLTLLVLAMMILPQGATSPIAFYLACIPTGLAAILATIVPPDIPTARRSFNLCFGFALTMTAYVLFQAWSFPGNPFANTVWTQTDRLIATSRRAISVEPSTTILASLTLLSPFLLYAASLAFFNNDKRALGLLKLIAMIGTAFAVFGLLQIWFLPGSLLLSPKVFYLDSLTSVFVNRNTAGTFLGVCSLAVLIQIVAVAQEIDGPHQLRQLISPKIKEISNRRLSAGLWATSLMACLLALFLTRSRGALMSTLAAYFLVVPLLGTHLSRRAGKFKIASPAVRDENQKWRGLARTAFVLAIILLTTALLGGRALIRLEQHPVDEARLCVYLSTWRAFLDHWLFGTGFGTFESVFPAYRSESCGWFYTRFGRAHNFYLEGLAGLGILFIFALAITYLHLVINLIHGYRSRRSLRYVPIAGIGAVTLVTFHGFVDFSLQVPGVSSLLAAFLGAVTTICAGRRTRAKQNLASSDE